MPDFGNVTLEAAMPLMSRNHRNTINPDKPEKLQEIVNLFQLLVLYISVPNHYSHFTQHEFNS